MAEETFTDFNAISTEDAQALREAIDTPAVAEEKKDELDATDQNADANKSGNDNNDSEGEGDNSSDDSDTLDVEKTPEELKAEADKKAAEDKANADKKAGDDKNGDTPAEDDKTLDIIDYNAALKTIGIEVATPITNQEEYINAIKADREALREKAKEELFLEVTEMANYDPEAQFHLKMIRSGVPTAELRTPGLGFDEMIAKSDEELMMAELLAGDVPEEEAKIKVAAMVDDDTLKGACQQLREGLKINKAEFVKKFNESKKAFVDTRMTELKNKSEKFDKDVVETIEKTDTFMGLKLTPALKEQLKSKYTLSQEYRMRLTSDPTYIAKLILQNELLERALDKIRKSSTETAKKEEKKANHTNRS